MSAIPQLMITTWMLSFWAVRAAGCTYYCYGGTRWRAHVQLIRMPIGRADNRNKAGKRAPRLHITGLPCYLHSPLFDLHIIGVSAGRAATGAISWTSQAPARLVTACGAI